MPYREGVLAENGLYHVYTRSIAGFEIFNNSRDYERIVKAMDFYSTERIDHCFAIFEKVQENQVLNTTTREKLVDIIAYCIMPTHIHLILKQLKEKGISRFMQRILNSYSKYFNIKRKRKGPLWEGRFNGILVKDDDQFLHLTRYLHLNPVTASLVENPEDWEFSSYREYLALINQDKKICEFSNYLSMDPVDYRRFVNDRIDYQRELALIKHSVLE